MYNKIYEELVNLVILRFQLLPLQVDFEFFEPSAEHLTLTDPE